MNLKIHIISRHSGADIINYERGFSQETKSKAIKLAKEVGSLEASKIIGLKYATVVRWRSGYIKKKTTIETKPLQHVAYGVLALGDSNYDQFCASGILVDKKFHECGGERVRPVANEFF